METFNWCIRPNYSIANEPDITEFFARHKGIQPFIFIDPLTKQRKKVICKKWPAKVGLVHTEFSCDFKEEP